MSHQKRVQSDGEIDRSPTAIKRQKSSNTSHTVGYRPEDYTVSWICALHIEMAAGRAMLDHVHNDLPRMPKDTNTYILGSIGPHNIVIACLPSYGTNNAATVGTNIERSFPSIEIHLMVGIGGGAPGKLDLRLGDIVVGSRVMQYDLGKIVNNGQIERARSFKIPPSKILTYIRKLRAIHETTPTKIPDILQEMYNKHPMMIKYMHPNAQDRLYRADFDHHSNAASCDECDISMIVHRLPRSSSHPKIYYDGIASGNLVIKHGVTRDRIAQELQVACFEMEAAGLMHLSCLTIRGICDYSDSHKNKLWQEYAAAVAAAYAKEFLDTIPIASTKAVAQDIECKAVEETVKDWWEIFLDSLAFEQIDSRHSNIKAAYTITCEWFLKSPEYLAWIDSAKLNKHRGFLWLSGKPGAGKSTIMKFAYTHLKKARRTTDAVISFFFNARGDVLEKSTIGMHRSLLFQLLKIFPHLQNVFKGLNLIRNGNCPSLEVMQILFKKAISTLGQHSLTCFIDALDECDELQVRDMVEFFEVLGQQAFKDKIELRICFSSRHYPYIFIRQGLRLTLEDQKGHEEDIQKYVQGNLKADPSPLLEDIQAQILQKAAGVFMWVVLVIEILNKEFLRGRLFAVKKRLAEIPDRLSDLFKDILKRDDENIGDLLLCLQWLLYAKRPLTREEFYFAILAGLSSEEEDATDYFINPVSIDIMDRFITSASKGLAEVNNNNTVQFIHQSVRDFFIKDNGIQEIWPEFSCDFEHLSHDKLKWCCYTYLMFNASAYIPAGNDLTKKVDEEMPWHTTLRQLSFLQYATQEVLYHANIAAISMPQDDFLKEFNLYNWIILHNIYQQLKIRLYTPNASLFYILADKGFSALIQIKLRHDSNCYIQGEHYRYPLFVALVNNRTTAVQLLLEQDACESDTTRRLQNIQDHPIYNQASFFWAIQKGYELIIQFLIEKGANVNMVDQDNKPALLIAMQRGYPTIAKLLIDKGARVDAKSGRIALLYSAETNYVFASAERLLENGADINSKNTSGQTPLLIAIRARNKNFAAELIRNGADVNAIDTSGETPLLIAIRARNDNIAAELIRNRADVNATDTSGETPLLIATKESYYTIARLLIKNGADIDIKDTSGQTAFNIAIRNNSYNIAEELIKKGANINPRDRSSETQFIITVKKGHYPMAKSLIEKGANVNDEDRSGESVFFIAMKNAKYAIAKLLIEKGADVNAKDITGETALCIAFMHEKDDIVRLLIENGADINGKSNCGQTLLFKAVWDGNEDIVRRLIDTGADIDIEDNTSQTALSIAVRSRHERIVRLLIDNGANMNPKGYSSRGMLCDAIFGRDENIIRLLIANGTDINDRDDINRTALLVAVSCRNEDVLRLLVEKGANLNAKDKKGRTALLDAVLWQNVDIIQLLLENGADINAKDNNGRTALLDAAMCQNEDILLLLLKNGADINAKDTLGYKVTDSF